MEKTQWTSADLHKLFKLNISKQTLINAEDRGEIPRADRVSRGKLQVRLWRLDQLPEIGSRFGFLQKPKNQKIICMYCPKGGVLKTTLGFNLARALALNGIRVLIIGFDAIQSSITNYALPPKEIESLEEAINDEYPGLYQFLFEKTPLERVIQKTNLPTLDIIPETFDVHHLNSRLGALAKREYFIKDKLVEYLSDYDVILFDNGANWNHLVENAIVASNNIIFPMGCEIEAFKAIDKAIAAIFDFKATMGISWDNFIQIPTLLERTKISQQIYTNYLSNYSVNVIPTPIRRNIKGQEARIFNRCVIEHEPASPLAQDYYDAITEIWKRINQG